MMLRSNRRGCRVRGGIKAWALLAAFAGAVCGCESKEAPSSATKPSAPAATPAAEKTTATAAAAQPASSSEDPVLLAKMNAPLASSKFGILTRMEILKAMRATTIEPLSGLPNDDHAAYEQLAALSDDALSTTARWLVSRNQSFDDFMKNGSEKNKKKFEDAFLSGQRRRTVMDAVLRRELYDKLPKLSEADLKGYYDKHLAQYKQPFQFYMRHLILMTYTEYTTQAGDTLESIAERLSGDKAKADDIRWNTEQRPLRREKGKDFRPLAPGEKLLVPMDETASQGVKKKLEDLLATVGKDGVTFEKIARENSMSSPPGDVIGPLPTGTREMLPEIIQYAKQTEEGGVSPVFRTPHGWQAIQVVKKRDEGIQPLKQVEGEVRNAILRDAQSKISDALIPKMYSDPDLKIEYELIAKSGDSMSTSTVIASVGDERLLWGTAKQSWIKYNMSKDPDQIKAALKTVLPLQQMLLVDMAKDDLKNPGSAVSKAVEQARRLSEGQAWIVAQSLIAARSEITTDTLRQYYEKEKQTRFKAVPKVTFMSIERRLTPEQRQKSSYREDLIALYNQFKKDLDALKTSEDFKAKAAESNAKLAGQSPAPPSADVPVSRDKLDPHIQAAIDTLEVGQWSPPILIDDSRLVSILLLSNVSEGYIPFEEAQGKADELVVNAAVQRHLKEIVEKLLSEAEFKPLP